MNSGDVCRHHDCPAILTVDFVVDDMASCYWFNPNGDYTVSPFPVCELRLVLGSHW